METPLLESLKLQNVSKSFGSTHVLSKLNFHLKAGQIVGIHGNNGSGKSTLLSIIAGSLSPDEGTLFFNGDDSTASQEVFQQSMGFLSHQPQLYAHLSGRENLLFFAKLYQIAKPNLRIEVLIETLDMADFVDRQTHTYSKGQVQRVAFARAVLHDPKLLLLDEPMNGLDTQSTDVLKRWIVRTKEQNGSVIVISHQGSLLNELADSVFKLERGSLHLNPDSERAL